MIMKNNDFYQLMVEEGIIDISNIQCPKCNRKFDPQNNSEKADGLRWFCNNKVSVNRNQFVLERCGGVRSARSNTWFFKSKLRIMEVLLLMYNWWYKIPATVLKLEFGFSDHTMVDWASYCREVAIDQVFTQSEKIGPNLGKVLTFIGWIIWIFQYFILFIRKVSSWKKSWGSMGIWRSWARLWEMFPNSCSR